MRAKKTREEEAKAVEEYKRYVKEVEERRELQRQKERVMSQ
jgi:hypothetical protein